MRWRCSGGFINPASNICYAREKAILQRVSSMWRMWEFTRSGGLWKENQQIQGKTNLFLQKVSPQVHPGWWIQRRPLPSRDDNGCCSSLSGRVHLEAGGGGNWKDVQYKGWWVYCPWLDQKIWGDDLPGMTWRFFSKFKLCRWLKSFLRNECHKKRYTDYTNDSYPWDISSYLNNENLVYCSEYNFFAMGRPYRVTQNSLSVASL